MKYDLTKNNSVYFRNKNSYHNSYENSLINIEHVLLNYPMVNSNDAHEYKYIIILK